MSVFAGFLNGMHIQMTRAAAESTASALIAGLWQSTVLVAGVWLVLKAVPRTTAAVRFAIWTLVFGFSALLPFLGILSGTHVPAATAQVRVDSEWSYLIAALWIAASTARLMQLAAQGWKLRGLWRRALPVEDEQLAGCGKALSGRGVRVCTSDDVDRPSVIGFFAPKILVPAWLLEQLSAMELRHIVLHEMDHLRRRDDWINLLQKIGLVLFPLNPAMLWVDRRLAAERELACDEGVLRQTKMRRAYATCLTSIAELRLERRVHRRVLPLALGALGTVSLLRGRSHFSQRIESILRRQAVMNPMLARVVAAALVLGVFGAGVELMRAPQLVSFAAATAIAETATDHGSSDGVRMREANFRVGEAKALGDLVARGDGSARQADLVVRPKPVSQRLKPRSKGTIYGTAEALPIRKMAISTLELSSTKTQKDFVPSGEAQSRIVSAKAPTEQPVEQWMVLTSSDENAPARVVVRMHDGRVYVAPYAAVPVRDGWLIVQL